MLTAHWESVGHTELCHDTALPSYSKMEKKRKQLNAELERLEEKYGDCKIIAIPKVGEDLIEWLKK